MSVTKYSRFEWFPGMKLTGHYNQWRVVSFDGEWLSFDDLMGGGAGCMVAKENPEPDLDDAETQGSIIFRTFAPLGIQIITSWGACRKQDCYRVNLACNGFCNDFGPEIESMSFASIADAIRAVFAALDSEAGR